MDKRMRLRGWITLTVIVGISISIAFMLYKNNRVRKCIQSGGTITLYDSLNMQCVYE